MHRCIINSIIMHNYLENSSDASLVIVRKTDLLLKKQENLQTSFGTSSICVININSVSVAPCRCGSKSDSTNMQPLLRFKLLLCMRKAHCASSNCFGQVKRLYARKHVKKQKHFYCSALKCILLGCFLSIDTITGISESS